MFIFTALRTCDIRIECFFVLIVCFIILEEMDLSANCITWWSAFFSGLAWIFKFLPSKCTESSIWHARPFAAKF